MYETLLVNQTKPHILQVTLNRPASMNAFNTAMARDLLNLFEDFSPQVAQDIRAVIITGAGDRAFCAGADLKERQGMSDEEWMTQHEIYEEMFAALGRCPVPVIMAVNGVALGGGCEIALTGDLIVAVESARFGQPEVKRGIMPGGGGTQRLARRVGPGRAKDLVLTGRIISAEEAGRWGLADRVVPEEHLMDEALTLAGMIAANGPIAVRQAKHAINAGADLPLDQGLAVEIEAYNKCIPTEDRKEGVDAFNEKRAPRFNNR